MHKKLSKNIKVVNGEVKFIKAAQRKSRDEGESPFGSDGDEDGTPTMNFFGRKDDEKKKQEEEQKRLEELRRTQAEPVLKKTILSRADLVHLLEDSIDKSAKKSLKDAPIRLACTNTRKFINKKSAVIEKEIPITTVKQEFIYKDDINQKEYEDLHAKNRIKKVEEEKIKKQLRLGGLK